MASRAGGESGVYSIRSAQRVCDILDLLQDSSDGASLPQVAAVTGLPKSSAFRYLATLEERRYVERDPSSSNYRLGLAFLPFQSRQFEVLAQRVRPRLEQLRDKLGETVNLGLLDGHRVTYLEIVESPRSVRLAARPGDRDWIHSTALGKAIGAQLPEERVRLILAVEGMPKFTDTTITDIDAYLEEMAAVRAAGHAVDDEENESGGRCVAVPLPLSRLPAAVSLSAPSSRLSLEQANDYAHLLQEVAEQLVIDLGGGAAGQMTSLEPREPLRR